MNIESFSKKPENHAEMVENMKILKELPENIEDPKVVIKLGDPKIPHKFITMNDEDGKEYIIAMPIDRKAYHSEILKLSKEMYKKEFKGVKGGYIGVEGDKLVISGSSDAFGRANHTRVAEILRKQFPEIDIVVRDAVRFETAEEGDIQKIVDQLNEATLFVDSLAEELRSMINQYTEGHISREDLAKRYSKYSSAISSLERIMELTKKVLNDVGAEYSEIKK